MKDEDNSQFDTTITDKDIYFILIGIVLILFLISQFNLF